MKTAETNPIYQSKILPIMQKAETEIKTLILVAFLYGKPQLTLLASILTVVNRVRKELPTEFGDTSAYVNGLLSSSDKMVKEYYNKPRATFLQARQELLQTTPADRRVTVNTPKELLDLTKHEKDLWTEAKGSPNVVNYPKELEKTIEKLSEHPIVTQEPGKKPISIWQKAELDTRYEHQMQMLQDLRVKGNDLCWISSHPDCSKRCQPWQGKLVSLSEPSTMSGFRIRKQDGNWVYSLTEIMEQTDKYGYHNNIINGFNCRHRLIPYTKGQLAPKEYTDKEVAKERDIETEIRKKERQIRLLKTKKHLYNESGTKKPMMVVKNKGKKRIVPMKDVIDYLEDKYKKYCEKNGYAWQEYRIKIK